MYFTMNLRGQVNQMRLPKSKALWPLFETIVNSIQSLEETRDCADPCITVLANRLGERQLNMNGEEELNHFEEFIVTDNGEGFTEQNYKSFLEAYTTYKIQKGCKGIGRFLWLKAFNKIEVNSIYTESGKWYRRKFTFSACFTLVFHGALCAPQASKAGRPGTVECAAVSSCKMPHGWLNAAFFGSFLGCQERTPPFSPLNSML